MYTAMGFLNVLCKEARTDAGLSQDQVAAQADVATSTICRTEHGDLEVTARVARALGELTQDLRLARYMFPWLFVQQRSTPTSPPGDPRKLVPDEIAALRKCVDALVCLEKIVVDGRVNADDDMLLADILKKHQQIREQTEALDRALQQLRSSTTRAS